MPHADARGLLPFVKMQGAGNDFVVLDAIRTPLAVDADLARRLADRQYGIGCDQVLVVEPSAVATVRMRVLNADGSEVETCGNGLRCVALYLHARGRAPATGFTIETGAGIAIPVVDDGAVRVDVGEPVWDGRRIPVAADGAVVDRLFEGAGERLRLTCVSMGNPHAVAFVDDVRAFPLARVGPALEHDAFFPQRTNVEVVQVVRPDRIAVRVWERGAGETLACGSGAAAAAAVALRAGRARSPVTVELPGGDLVVRWDGRGAVELAGPAHEVYAGEVDPARLAARPGRTERR